MTTRQPLTIGDQVIIADGTCYQGEQGTVTESNPDAPEGEPIATVTLDSYPLAPYFVWHRGDIYLPGATPDDL